MIYHTPRHFVDWLLAMDVRFFYATLEEGKENTGWYVILPMVQIWIKTI